ncbi:MAG: hypothetical protein ABSG25_06940 [Bryobacteraceae bacterium]
MRTVTCLIAAVIITGSGFLAHGKGGDPTLDALQQRLNAQFALTEDFPGAGAVLQKGGLMMYSDASPEPPTNTYKNGIISHGSNFGRDLLTSMATPGAATSADFPHRQFDVGEKILLIKLWVHKHDMVFRVYSDPYDGIRYYGDLKFPFGKDPAPTPDQALAMIAEVLTVEQASNDMQAVTAPPVAGQVEQIAGTYVMAQATDNRLQLNSDGTFSLVQAGRNVSGNYTIIGDKLMLRWVGHVATGVLQGDSIIDDEKLTWVKENQPVTPPDRPQPLRLPSTYVNAQAAADHLQLNADNSFSLQESGQKYHGIFQVNGNTVELGIIETNTQTTAKIQGNSLTDASGQTWNLQAQSAGIASGAAVLHNDDIVKMAKAGFGDAIIVAKIRGSNCQFDTSTDALIQLKQNGVSAAVITAMIGK